MVSSGSDSGISDSDGSGSDGSGSDGDVDNELVVVVSVDDGFEDPVHPRVVSRRHRSPWRPRTTPSQQRPHIWFDPWGDIGNRSEFLKDCVHAQNSGGQPTLSSLLYGTNNRDWAPWSGNSRRNPCPQTHWRIGRDRQKDGSLFDVRRIGVRDLGRSRAFEITEGLLTDDPFAVVSDPTVDIVVEVMGGLDPAGDLVLAALDAGKPVISANKELISARGPELIAAAERAGVPFLFEAAVGGEFRSFGLFLRPLQGRR